MKTLAALLLGGAVLLGCGEKPQPKLFINPRTGERIQEGEDKTKMLDETVKKEDDGFGLMTFNGDKYYAGYGTFEIGGLEYKGIILKKDSKRYGVVKTLPTYVKLNGQSVAYRISKPKENIPTDWFNDNRWIEQQSRHMAQRTFGEKEYYLTFSNRNVCDPTQKRILEKLPLLFIPKKTLERLEKNGRKVLADFYVPFLVD